MTGIGKGILIGLGIGAVGFYLYKKNEQKVDSLLRGYGIPIPTANKVDFDEMSIEELMETKETIEDIIAERELSEEEQTVTCTNEKIEIVPEAKA